MNILHCKGFASFCCFLPFFVLFLLLVLPMVFCDTWSAYQHDLGHAGFTSEAPDLPLEIKWYATLCPWMNGGLSPIVSDGTYCIVGSFRDYNTLFPQSTENLEVWCVRNSDGSIAWHFETGGIVVGSPQIAGDKVYVVSWDSRESEVDPYASSLWALRLSNGSIAWEKHFEEWWASPPSVSGDTLVVPVMYKPFLQNADGVVYAYNATTGMYLWNYPAQDRMICDDWYPDRPNPPCIYDNKVYFQDTRHVYAVNLTDGSDAWTTNSVLGLDFWSLQHPMVAADGKLLFVDTNVDVEGDARIVCLRADNGKFLWQWLKQGEPYCSSRISGLSYANGNVYASLSWTQINDAIVEIDGDTGLMIRRSLTGGSVARTPIITGDGNVFYLSFRSYILNPLMDQILFDFTQDHGMNIYGGDSHPALVNSLVVTDIHPYNLDNYYLTAFGHDTTPPVADITQPSSPLFNPGKIDISGFATDFNFDYWDLSYARLEDTDNWTIVTSDTKRKSYESDFISYWDVKTIGDGNWRIRLRSFDKAGLSSMDDSLTISQDHTLPESFITYPTGGLILETLSLEITGTATDNMGLSKVQVWDSLSGLWHDAQGTSDWTYQFSTTNSCTDVSFKSRAIDWAGNTEVPKPAVLVTLSPHVKVIPVDPIDHAEISEVMQGGYLHRWVKVVDSQDNPVAKAKIYYSTATGTKNVTAGNDGVVDLNISSLSLFPTTTRITEESLVNIPITEVRYSTCSFTALEPFPTIPVLVKPREAEHVWSAGLGQGLKAGITAYVESQAGGGTEVSIDNSQNLSITQNFDAGIGLGVEAGPDFELGVAEAGANVDASFMLLLRGDQVFNMGDALCSDMGDTECKRRRQAYATLMIASMARTASVLSHPTVNIIIGALTAAGYHGYLEKESISAGVSLSAGGSISSSLGLSSDSGVEAGIGLSLIDASFDLAYLIGMNWYPKTDRFGIQAIQEIQTSLSVLSFSVAGQGLVSADDYFGLDGANNSFSFTEEMIFDSSWNPCEFILTISDGEEIVIYRIDDMERIQQLLSTGAANIRALAESMGENPGGLQLGVAACSRELTRLFYALLQTPVDYERRAVYKVKDFDYTLSLDFNIQIVTVGGSLSVNYEEKRVYAAELGVIEGGVRKAIQTYSYDTYVRGDNHSLGDLMSAILEGLWSFVDDAIDWVKDTASSAASWVVDTFSIGGEIRNSATVLMSDPPLAPWARLSGEAHSLSKTTDISIISYAPQENPMEGLTVIGKCHDFQPGDLVPLLALTLEIGYGFDPLPPKAVPSNMGLYHWNNNDAKWEIVSGAVMDTITAHTATASVMNLGLYAVGLDLTSPTVTLLPTASDGFTTPGALISAIVYDRVSGLDIVELEIDDTPVSFQYDWEKELMTYTPQPPLSAGQHELKITASDMAGNSGVSVWNVTVDDVPPTSQITQPTGGAMLKGVVNITGTANDANFDYYLVQLKPKKGSALWWIGLPKRTPVQNGLLLELDSRLVDDGAYTLILEVRDKAGNKSRAELEVTLNNHSHGILAR